MVKLLQVFCLRRQKTFWSWSVLRLQLTNQIHTWTFDQLITSSRIWDPPSLIHLTWRQFRSSQDQSRDTLYDKNHNSFPIPFREIQNLKNQKLGSWVYFKFKYCEPCELCWVAHTLNNLCHHYVNKIYTPGPRCQVTISRFSTDSKVFKTQGICR